MRYDDVKDGVNRLKPQANQLQGMKIKRLALIGSIARDASHDGSDFDFLVEFTVPATFDLFFDLKHVLEDQLGRPVDPVNSESLKPVLKPYVEKDLIDVIDAKSRAEIMAEQIRAVDPGDAEAIKKIYSPYVEHTAISFEEYPPSVEEIRARITHTLKSYPWLINERDGLVLGYAYASQHRQREAYRWSVDVACYVDEKYRGQGIGKELYTQLLKQLKQLRFANAFAGIALPNPASVRLHELMGFKPIGVYQKVGYKLGKWHDVGWWQLMMDHPERPTEPGS